MEDKYLILSDIHGNVSAFDAVLSDCKDEDFSGVLLLGDLIDYGMRSNEIQVIGTYLSSLWSLHCCSCWLALYGHISLQEMSDYPILTTSATGIRSARSCTPTMLFRPILISGLRHIHPERPHGSTSLPTPLVSVSLTVFGLNLS